MEFARALRDILAGPPTPCVVMGIHMEGPYLSPASRGANNAASITDPDHLPLARLLDAGGDALKYLSLSPDVPGASDVVRECVRRGVRVGLGHSLTAPAVVQQAIEAGAGSIIHTFNNTPDYPMREPGVRGVTIDEVGLGLPDLMNEVICDGIHVDPILVRALERAKGCRGVMLVTDSLGGGRLLSEGAQIGMGLDTITVRDGGGRLANGGMAGSTLTMERAFRNYFAFTGASMHDARRDLNRRPPDPQSGVVAATPG
jgi:N-acetylglucosamine-6-phosphate deacetylase